MSQCDRVHIPVQNKGQVILLSQKLFLETELSFCDSPAQFHKQMKFQMEIVVENYEKPSRSELWKKRNLCIISQFFQILCVQPSEKHPMEGQLSLDILMVEIN